MGAVNNTLLLGYRVTMMLAFGLLIFCLTSIGRTFLVGTKGGTHSSIGRTFLIETKKGTHSKDSRGLVKSEFGGDYDGPSEEKGKGRPSETSGGPSKTSGPSAPVPAPEPASAPPGPSETSGGPVRVEDDSGKCLFTCNEDGGCKVKWYNYNNNKKGGGYCLPRSRKGGICSLGGGVPPLCKDCHATRARKNGSPCKEPKGEAEITSGGSSGEPLEKSEVTCNFYCDQGVYCMVEFSKSASSGKSFGIYPHYEKDLLPEECHDKCLKALPECETPKSEVKCEYYCDEGQICMVKFAKMGGLGSTWEMFSDDQKDKIPKECHDKCQKKIPECAKK